MTNTPFVTLMCEFAVKSKNKGSYSKYIDYMDREETKNNYQDYIDYMSNKAKTNINNQLKTNLYSSISKRKNENLTEDEKENLKEIFNEAEKKGSILWKDVISFNNEQLEKAGIYNSKTRNLDEKLLIGAVRKTMNGCFESENLKGTAIWSASFHYNTDNIHIHISSIEPNPTKQKGKRKLSTISRMKSDFINYVLCDTKDYIKISNMLRENLLFDYKVDKIYSNDEKLRRLYFELGNKIPKNIKLLQYNRKNMIKYKKDIDNITTYYLNTYKKNDFKKFKKELKEQENKLLKKYGDKKYKNYRKNKIKELYRNLGNVTLKQIENIRESEEMIKTKSTKQELKKNNKQYKKNNNSYNNINMLKRELDHNYNNYMNMLAFNRLTHTSNYKSYENGIN